jgi:surface antigen
VKTITKNQVLAIATTLALMGTAAADSMGGLGARLYFGHLGKAMDQQDRAKALEYIKSGQPGSWKNEKTGNEFSLKPESTYVGAAGRCRNYVLEAKIKGKDDKTQGTACKTDDGSWNSGA